MRRLYTTVIILFDSYEVTKSIMKVKAVNPSFVLCLSILMTGYVTISCKRMTLQYPNKKAISHETVEFAENKD
jgi:hypothetical protein